MLDDQTNDRPHLKCKRKFVEPSDSALKPDAFAVPL